VLTLGEEVRNIVIVGGGSAGWLTAGVIAAEHGARNGVGMRITVIESPDVAPIGVGEGTWPTMRDTLRAIGVSESDFIRECDASFKQGSRFDGWVDGSEGDRCYHPFVLPCGHTETDLVAGWLSRRPDLPFSAVVSFQPHLCARNLAPKQPSTPEYAAVANYAYHLDAGKFGRFLRDHCIARLGVTHIPDHVVGVIDDDSGDIAGLRLKDHGIVEGDLFVDCTGMQSLLIGKHFDIDLISMQSVLFCDSALAVQVPYARPDQEIASQTNATAQRSGWIWDIGLPTRRGVGYVYSSAHTTDDAAEAELHAYLGVEDAPERAPTVRKLSFVPGHRARFWHRNCVAIGLSAGFIEPLEASAIALVELSAAMLRDDMPATRSDMEIVARRFNDAFAYRWGRVIDFLKLHYVLTRRVDSDFWRDNVRTASIPERLREQLALWRHRPPSRYDFHRIEEVFPSASYHYILYGMGFRPERGAGSRRSRNPAAADGFFQETSRMTAKMLAALPGNRALNDHIRSHGLPRI
jgi:tryptophan halogenase